MKNPFQSLPARTTGIALCLIMLLIAFDGMPTIWKYVVETIKGHDSTPGISEYIRGLGPVGIGFAIVILMMAFAGIIGLLSMLALMVVGTVGLLKLCFFTKWTPPTTLHWVIFSFLLPFLIILVWVVISILFK